MTWEPVIGLEVHVQLKTHSKIFSGASTAFGALPNTQACAIDLGMPGILPVLNKQAVILAVRFGLATESRIAKRSLFARKNYFYPDLPKGYQISQHECPIVQDGFLDIEWDQHTKRVAIARAHLEEDAGKSLHDAFPTYSGIDLNRAGIPLLEIVSQPDLRSPQEAVAYLKALHELVCFLDISDGNMQEGSFRCDANVSVRQRGAQLGTRTETKNLNSFRYVEQAITYEIQRQIALLEQGQPVIQQTLLFDPVKQETRPLRQKEEANDYLYFPEPDLLPLVFDEAFISDVKRHLPETPQAKRKRFQQTYGLNPADIQALTHSKVFADYYEAVVNAMSQPDPKLAANWVLGELSGALNKSNLDIVHCPIAPQHLAALLQRLLDHTISSKIAKTVFEALWHQEGTPDTIIEKRGLKQVTDVSAITQAIQTVLTEYPEQVSQYRSGKEKVFGFLVGQVLKNTSGKANPAQVNALLKEALSS